jgi:hypothetical protein
VKKRMMTLIAVMIAAAAITARPTAAQMMPPSNFNQMVQNQIRMQQIGDQMARNAARAYYLYALRLRQMGYKGEIPTGVTAQSLNAANQAAAQAGSNYIQNSQANMHRTWDAITSTSNAITRGCTSQYWNGYRWICQ